MLLAMPRHILTLPEDARPAKRVEVDVVDTPPRVRREPREPVLAVDFSWVPGHQRDLDRRLRDNWLPLGNNRPKPQVSAGFDKAQSSDARVTDKRAYGDLTRSPFNLEDGERLDEAIKALALDARNDGFRRARALDWYYRDNCRDANGTRESLHFSLHGLADCVIAARGWLIERGV